MSDVGMVPPGSVLINPDTGTPYLNSDGSVYMFDPSNPPRMDAGVTQPQPPSISPYPAPAPGQEMFPGGPPDLAKMSLEADQMSVGSHNSSQGHPSNMSSHPLPAPAWQVSRMPLQPAPYILVNPVSNIPIPQYIPYLSQQQQQTAPAAPAGPAPAPPQARPLLFSLHRSPHHSLILYLQHSPSLLTRAQLTSFLDSFLGPASPQLHGGQWQFLDQTGVWCDLATLPDSTPATNRFPIQIYFENEDMAGQTVAALRQVGFLQYDPTVDNIQQ